MKIAKNYLEIVNLEGGDPDACWHWGHSKVKGHGTCTYQGQFTYVHILSYQLHVGEVPDGMVVDHICGTTDCWNPAHLRAVTHKQNIEHRTKLNRNNKSGVRGVYWNKRHQQWWAEVKHNGKKHYAGKHDTLEEAAAAVAAKRGELGFLS